MQRMYYMPYSQWDRMIQRLIGTTMEKDDGQAVGGVGSETTSDRRDESP